MDTLDNVLFRHQDSRRKKRSRGTDTEPCYLLPPGVALWPRFEGIRADKATMAMAAATMTTNEVEVMYCDAAEAAVDMEVDEAVEAALPEAVARKNNGVGGTGHDSGNPVDDSGQHQQRSE